LIDQYKLQVTAEELSCRYMKRLINCSVYEDFPLLTVLNSNIYLSSVKPSYQQKRALRCYRPI